MKKFNKKVSKKAHNEHHQLPGERAHNAQHSNQEWDSAMHSTKVNMSEGSQQINKILKTRGDYFGDRQIFNNAVKAGKKKGKF